MKKMIELCKLIWNLVVVEEEIVFVEKFEIKDGQTCLPYKDPSVRNLIHAFKYRRNISALKICADILSKKIIFVSKRLDLNNSLLIPIPRSKSRRKKFGFDQCELLCREILKNPEIKNLNLIFMPNILIHQKEFDSQTKSNRKQRIKNSQNTFLIKAPEKICARKIILIDDVWTTGATLSDATRALNEAKPKKIFRFTIAH